MEVKCSPCFIIPLGELHGGEQKKHKIFVQIVFAALSALKLCLRGVAQGSPVCLREERSDTVGSLQGLLGPGEPFQAEDGILLVPVKAK